MTNTQNTKNILSIAGSDPSGGAGIQADLKSIAATGGYGMAAISALTAQNTRGVRSVHVPPAGFLTEQLNAVSEDIAIDAIKIGMLGDRATVRLTSLLNAGPFTLEAGSRDTDRYGRKLRVVRRDGHSLGEVLVAEGLARLWDGSRHPWC